tara:strand:- start:26 stop:721 length:696 start_codon:yes stop_codon:yes gene_type:complete
MKLKSGLWRLSPSSLYAYSECKSCFWVDNHFKRAPMLPLLLNSAMDSILKHRYDKYRKKKTFPPEAKELLKEGIKPFMDLEKLELWREKMSSLQVENEEVGYVLRGKIDDVLVEEDGRLIPADYKSSGNAPAEDKQKYYRDQLAAYGYMFKKHGYKVSNRAYLLHYFVKDKTDPSIDVKFDSHVDLVEINPARMERKLKAMVKLLNGKYPGHNPKCEKCAFYVGRQKKAKR